MKYDGAQLDRMYNAREAVPGYAEHFRKWAAWSQDAMRGGARALDVRYGGGSNEHLDIFRTEKEHAPVLVFIHGGYWRSLDKKDHAFVAPPFTRHGICVVVPNYALCPAVTIPGIVMQMVRALAWTWKHIEQYGGDRNRIHVAGHSAGGHLAAMMAACAWSAFDPALPKDVVKGAMSISGLHDLEPIMHTPFLQPSLHLTAEQVRKASPARLPAPDQGKLYSVSGGLESEEFHRQTRLMRDVWGDKRVPVCELMPGRNHFTVLEGFTEPGNRLHELGLELVQG
ncbi:MAG TPA: alpha/beta hydrolase [Ramlibacter sp.]|nr:alpha/beta hydrolase [Ramlibacter sp.]